MPKKDLFWVKLHFKDLAIEVLGMNQQEKGDFLDKMIIDLSKKESDNKFINDMLEEIGDFYEKKSKAGKASSISKKNNNLQNQQCSNNDEQRTNNVGLCSNQNKKQNKNNKEIKENTKRKVPSVEETELSDLVDFWNGLEWTKKVKFPNANSKANLVTDYRAVKKSQGKDFLSKFMEEIPKNQGCKNETWFTLRNLLGSRKKADKLMDGTYRWIGGEKPTNQATMDLGAFYGSNSN